MKKLLFIACMVLTGLNPLHSHSLFAEEEVSASDVFVDYQNYNHDYCPTCDCNPCRCNYGPVSTPCQPNVCEPSVCDPCDANVCEPSVCEPCNPCAPVCGSECGISVCAIGVAIAALATAAVLIVSSGNGSASH